jgi:hypothetical protein
MIKALGAFFFGLAAVCGVVYLIIRKQEDQTMRKQIDTAVENLGKSLKNLANRTQAAWLDMSQPKNIPVTEEAA